MESQTQSDNIRYCSDGIVNCFDGYRDKWEDFYPSEKWAFQTLADQRQGRLGRILDVGCAIGGLGLALSSRFVVEDYTGIDINPQVIERAQNNLERFSVPANFHCEDILDVRQLPKASFDIVISLSCADWNIATRQMIDSSWDYVRPGGSFVMSVRLTDREGLNDFTRSHQTIAFDEKGDVVESANYVVFNWREYLALCQALRPSPNRIRGYGYWGEPASNAVTPYQRLVFGVVIIQQSKASPVEPGTLTAELNLPLDLITG